MPTEMKTEVQLLRESIATADAALLKAAEFIEQAQPALDKQAMFEARFQKRAREIAGVLAHRGVIPVGETEALVQKLAEDRVRALDLVERLATMIGPDQMGKQSDVRVPAGQKLDGFERLVLFGDANSTQSESPLNV